ncbi:hypothetical protein IWW37_003369 [Coemansia sp. RSA 2050]|nr:hypothetical protein IWW37_003369 [Coemansia sp. RSA 2050]KAJ2732422.1 hypothetical protein IW152_003817 [Coemansia sp. BCRC 34962]
MDLPNDNQRRRQTWELNQARWRLGMDKHMINNRLRKLAKQRRRVKTSEALLQWQQQWDQALADVEVPEYRLGEHQWICQQQYQDRMQQNREAKLKRKQQRDMELELARRERVQL